MHFQGHTKIVNLLSRAALKEGRTLQINGNKYIDNNL